MSNLDKLMYLAGISAEYFDYHGHQQLVPDEQRVRILAAMGYPVSDQQEIDDLVFTLDASPWQTWIRPVNLLSSGQPLTFSFRPDEIDCEFSWVLTLEDETRLTGCFKPANYPECGDYFIGPVRYSGRAVDLPALPQGYHSMEIRRGDTSVSGEVIVSPPRCFETSVKGDKRWGITCQLYSLRSPRNWGYGDFLDLIDLIDNVAPFGADLIGLNPLHALCSHHPDAVSPYSPSDRRFYNPLYIAPEMVPEFSAELLSGNRELTLELAALRKLSHVDYTRVGVLKYRFYEVLYEKFLAKTRSKSCERYGAFIVFQNHRGESLREFCAYEVRHNPCGEKYSEEPEFFAYLQWLCTSQLAYCQDHALKSGMAIGLIGDMAVGSVAEGNEVVSNPELYRRTATVGAPPDPFSSTGQDWGLPVLNPISIGQNRYRNFIRLLRANMENYGSIRIDHVMSLMRLWWCLLDDDTQQLSGAYVYYPFHELLALVRLESHRCRCQVIGEDLGVVPEEIRHRMEDNGLLGNTLFYFEQHHNHFFKSPHEQREQAALMITNHDVPTLTDWWNEGDIHRRFDLGVIHSEDELSAVTQQRKIEKNFLLQLLAEQDLLPQAWKIGKLDKVFDWSLCEAIHRLCARSESRWLLLQLEDLQLVEEPVNIPGTFREYPNWRRKQVRNTKDIFISPAVKQLLNQVKSERSGNNA